MRNWIRLATALLAIALLLLLGWRMFCGMFALLDGTALSHSAEPDPMFAEEAEPLPTRPPELYEEQPQPDHPTLDDYAPEAQSPVDVTADELIRQARERVEAMD